MSQPQWRARVAQGAAWLSAGLGVWISISVGFGQLDLAALWRGDMPLNVAFSIHARVLAFLSLLLLVSIASLVIALWHSLKPWQAGVLWLGVGGVLSYFIYLARFSIGPYLIIPVALVMLAAILSLWQSFREHI
jgi:hypothetical protein